MNFVPNQLPDLRLIDVTYGHGEHPYIREMPIVAWAIPDGGGLRPEDAVPQTFAPVGLDWAIVDQTTGRAWTARAGYPSRELAVEALTAEARRRGLVSPSDARGLNDASTLQWVSRVLSEHAGVVGSLISEADLQTLRRVSESLWLGAAR